MMIKKLYKSGLAAAALPVVLLAFSGCSDQFMKDKTNYNLISPDAVYSDYNAALARVNYLYNLMMPPGPNYSWYSVGRSDIFSQSTEEYGSLSPFWITEGILDVTANNNPSDFFFFELKATGPYGRIRECNDLIENVIASTFTEQEKNDILGQAYFFRAWQYLEIVKMMGGIPIIDKVQDPVVGDGNKESLHVPRSTTKACIDFICNDLRTAAYLLPESWLNESVDYGRITKGTALAVMGRARLLYASPIFNRQDDKARWELAYEVNKEAKDLLAYDLGDPGTNASEWARMFAPIEIAHKEGVMTVLYSNNEDHGKNNSWEQAIRPKNIYGGNGIDVTAEMIDLFPMADGKRPASLAYEKLTASSHEYNENLFFLNRDPRFYRTFAFPGVRWAANATFSSTVRSDTLGIFLYPYQGREYELWSYAWFKDISSRDDTLNTSGSWVADGIGSERKTIYLRKRSDDYDIARTSMYDFTDESNIRFTKSYAPYLELRYGEVLLNFAESACGAGKGTEALEALRELRRRVGYTGDCGLESSLANDRAALFAAILYERQIELAYEGKRFDDMRRWMLWDGGANQFMIDGAPDSWMPSGWENNTCKYLGVPALNGTRRHRYYVASQLTQSVQNNNGIEADTVTIYDPIQLAAATGIETAERPKALDLMTDAVDNTGAMAALVEFYGNNLKIKKLDSVDGTKTENNVTTWDGKTISYKPEYYFMPLKYNAQANNPTLLQTIGWRDRQGHGVWFDPLAE